MNIGGDTEKHALHEAFSKIKEDMEMLTSELSNIKSDHKKLQEENIELRKQLGHGHMDPEIIARIVKETLKNVQPQKHAMHHVLMKKLNKGRKNIIMSKIIDMASKKNHSPSDIKEMIVDNEHLCSKATFYRYLEKMKARHLIDFMRIDEMDVIVKI